MPAIVVLYATREGHTKMVAERVAATLRRRNLFVDVLDVTDVKEPFPFEPYDGAVIAASIHMGRHERDMVGFVSRHRAELGRLPTALLSVSLSQAAVEMESVPPQARAKNASHVTRMLEDFYSQTGWHPARTKAVAGALPYSRYNFFVRFMMKRIAKGNAADDAHLPTDTSRDYDFTDWDALDRFVDAFAGEFDPHGRLAKTSANVVS